MSAGRPGMVSKCHDAVPGEPLSVSWNNEKLFAELGSGVPEEIRAMFVREPDRRILTVTKIVADVPFVSVPRSVVTA